MINIYPHDEELHAELSEHYDEFPIASSAFPINVVGKPFYAPDSWPEHNFPKENTVWYNLGKTSKPSALLWVQRIKQTFAQRRSATLAKNQQVGSRRAIASFRDENPAHTLLLCNVWWNLRRQIDEDPRFSAKTLDSWTDEFKAGNLDRMLQDNVTLAKIDFQYTDLDIVREHLKESDGR